MHYLIITCTVAFLCVIPIQYNGVLSGNSETAAIGLLADEDATTLRCVLTRVSTSKTF